MVDPTSVEKATQRLREAGLNVKRISEKYYRIYRPRHVPGNRREDYEEGVWGWGDDGLPATVDVTDAPSTHLFETELGEWELIVHTYVPGPGPGDFQKLYAKIEDAIPDILEYYFGDPAWMCAEYDAYWQAQRTKGHN